MERKRRRERFGEGEEEGEIRSAPGSSASGTLELTITSGRLVAASTTTPLSSSIPSISVSKLIKTRSPVDPPLSSEPRAGARASISSCEIEGTMSASESMGECPDLSDGTHEEDDGWSSRTSLPEDLADGLLRLAHVLVKDL